VIGQPETLEPGLRRIVAPNPSPMTFRGTNTYMLGETDVAVIDPGPLDDTHLETLIKAALPGRITHIFVTHAHLDHSPLARPLAQATGAQIYAFGSAQAGRSTIMQRLSAQGLVGGGEGVDTEFTPDVLMHDGMRVDGPDWSLQALHTPGHMANHLSFAWGDVLFSGDLVMSWATSLVSPPDGDLTAFMASCRRLLETPWRVFHAGHGAPVDDPQTRVQALLTHRMGREDSILNALNAGPATAQTLAEAIYTDTPPALMRAATRNVLAHLIDLVERNKVKATTEVSEIAQFERV
jgi:glyoxylase-like metal-dependent hydrolase (beta-lactamase superfamily II)